MEMDIRKTLLLVLVAGIALLIVTTTLFKEEQIEHQELFLLSMDEQGEEYLAATDTDGVEYADTLSYHRMEEGKIVDTKILVSGKNKIDIQDAYKVGETIVVYWQDRECEKISDGGCEKDVRGFSRYNGDFVYYLSVVGHDIQTEKISHSSLVRGLDDDVWLLSNNQDLIIINSDGGKIKKEIPVQNLQYARFEVQNNQMVLLTITHANSTYPEDGGQYFNGYGEKYWFDSNGDISREELIAYFENKQIEYADVKDPLTNKMFRGGIMSLSASPVVVDEDGVEYYLSRKDFGLSVGRMDFSFWTRKNGRTLLTKEYDLLNIVGKSYALPSVDFKGYSCVLQESVYCLLSFEKHERKGDAAINYLYAFSKQGDILSKDEIKIPTKVLR